MNLTLKARLAFTMIILSACRPGVTQAAPAPDPV